MMRTEMSNGPAVVDLPQPYNNHNEFEDGDDETDDDHNLTKTIGLRDRIRQKLQRNKRESFSSVSSSDVEKEALGTRPARKRDRFAKHVLEASPAVVAGRTQHHTIAHGLKMGLYQLTLKMGGRPRVFGSVHITVFEARNLVIVGGSHVDGDLPTPDELINAQQEKHSPFDKTTRLGDASPPEQLSRMERLKLKTGAKRASCSRSMLTCMSCGCADGRADPYVSVWVIYPNRGANILLGESYAVTNDAHPQWDFEVMKLVDFGGEDDPDAYLEIRLLDNDWMTEGYQKNLGSVKFSPKEIIEKPDVLTEWHKLKVSPVLPHVGEIRLGIRYWPLASDEHSVSVQGSRKDLLEVPNTYYSAEAGNIVHLYHDADVLHHHLPAIRLANGSTYKADSAWTSIQEAMDTAKHFIFAAGWSVNTQISLRRGYKHGEKFETIGDLLLRKAKQGVMVVLGLWDDMTSGMFYKTGIMGTNDEYTKAFFANTPVKVALIGRRAMEQGKVKNLLAKATFTHHQKLVCVDQASSVGVTDSRVLVSFFGGLDLTNGRYDTAKHSLFETIETAHCDDFHNACVPEVSKQTGPREPWHDIHGRIEGPGAWDILENFLERIERQVPDFVKDTKGVVDRLLGMGTLAPKKTYALEPRHPASWKTQVFRTIDADSAKFENEDFLAMFHSPELAVDTSIQQAYLYHIDRAKRYLYFENQYFLGSSGFWRSAYDGVPSYHLVPWAIAKRVVRAVQTNENFAVYVLIPLFPEGVPSTRAVQEILHWQHVTIQTLYSEIAEALKAAGSKAKPTDYLNFFFVGARESGKGEGVAGDANPQLKRTVANRRHQIYVHSKMFIVDDEYVLLGSANINERSMAGNRDTEIAGGCWQPNFVANHAKEGSHVELPRGEVYGFRCSLWAEHFGQVYPEFADPGSTSCVTKVRELASANWNAYVAPRPIDMPFGHMCLYPYRVTDLGVVEALPDHPNIPDTDAKVVGKASALLLDVMTT